MIYISLTYSRATSYLNYFNIYICPMNFILVTVK